MECTVKAIIISGRSGSGKSTTTYEAAHILKQHGIFHVTIEGDNLDTMYPKGDEGSLLFQNLESVWAAYWAQACALWVREVSTHAQFVVLLNGTGMVLNLERLETTIRDVAFAGDFAETNRVIVEVLPVVLIADDTTVTERLTTREIGGELEEHLLSTRRMNLVLDEWSQRRDGPVGRISSQGRDVHDVATEILQLAGIVLEEKTVSPG